MIVHDRICRYRINKCNLGSIWLKDKKKKKTLVILFMDRGKNAMLIVVQG